MGIQIVLIIKVILEKITHIVAENYTTRSLYPLFSFSSSLSTQVYYRNIEILCDLDIDTM